MNKKRPQEVSMDPVGGRKLGISLADCQFQSRRKIARNRLSRLRLRPRFALSRVSRVLGEVYLPVPLRSGSCFARVGKILHTWVTARGFCLRQQLARVSWENRVE